MHTRPPRLAPSARWQYAALALLVLIAGAYQAINAKEAIAQLFGGEARARRPFVVDPFSAVILDLRPEGAEAGLMKGDRLVRVGDQPFTGAAVLGRAIALAHPAGTLPVTVHRGSSEARQADLDVAIVLRGRARQESTRAVLLQVGLLFVTPALCLVLGFGVAAVRPRDPVAWLLLLMMLSFAQVAGGGSVDHTMWPAPWRAPGIAYQALSFWMWPIGMMLFGIYFPARFDADRHHPWLKWLLVVPVGVIGAAAAIHDVGVAERAASVRGLDRALEAMGIVPTLLTMAAISVFFTTLGIQGGTAASPDARRRLRLLLWGSQISLSPVGALVVIGLIVGKNPFTQFPFWAIAPPLALLPLFPLTLAYVIVVHRALDVRVVIRQGLRYALARNAILAVQILMSIGATLLVVSVVQNRAAIGPAQVVYGVTIIVLVVVARRAGERARGWIDRRFFRDAYDAERVLTELSESVRSIVEIEPLLDTVARRIADSLHVRQIVAFLLDDHAYAAKHALGFAVSPLARFAEHGSVAARLTGDRRAIQVYLDDPQSWVNDAGVTAEERVQLEALVARVLLPLPGQKRLLGFFSLAPKQSDEPYSPSDLRVLESVAVQTGLALENGQLTAAIASEIAQRERARREIEIAREVQEQLFPQRFPAVPGLDYAGRCRPARGVGGDYYDFLELTSGRFGLAVGDISGKGVPAALLMASLQASLRAQTIGGEAPLASLTANLNRLIYDASPPNRYATFFYAQYNPASRELTYVNAGHCPPMLFRSVDGSIQVIRLEEGGSVIGLLSPAEFREGTLTLERGDVLVAYTDGISEAMNAADDEWGEERLVAAASGCLRLPASEIVRRLMASADEFVAGAPQHDDMTVVVACVR